MLPISFVLPPWVTAAVSPVAAIGRGVLKWLKAINVTVNGVVIASLVACMAAGGWWIARQARADERARIATARAKAAADLNADLGKLIDERAGRITLSRAERDKISAALRDLVARLPAEVVRETTYVPLSVPLPTPVAVPAAASPPRRAAVTATAPTACLDYPEDIRATVSRINVNQTGGK